MKYWTGPVLFEANERAPGQYLHYLMSTGLSVSSPLFPMGVRAARASGGLC